MYFVEIPLPKKNMGDSTWHLERKKIFNKKLKNFERIVQISPDDCLGIKVVVRKSMLFFKVLCARNSTFLFKVNWLLTCEKQHFYLAWLSVSQSQGTLLIFGKICSLAKPVNIVYIIPPTTGVTPISSISINEPIKSVLGVPLDRKSLTPLSICLPIYFCTKFIINLITHLFICLFILSIIHLFIHHLHFQDFNLKKSHIPI